MKKIATIFLSVCMLFCLYVPVSAADTEKTHIDDDAAVSVVPLTPLKNDGVFVPVEAEGTSQDESGDTSKAAPVTRIYGEYLRVYPLYEENGEYYYLKSCYRQYAGSMSATYIRQLITREVQEEMKQEMVDRGHVPVGWYLEGSIYMNVKKAKYIQYEITDHNGTGPLRQQTAFVGSNTFSCMALYPEDTSVLYEYGMSGTAYYVGYSSMNTSSMSIGLHARFEGAV